MVPDLPPPPLRPPVVPDPSMPSVGGTPEGWRKAALHGYMGIVLLIAVIAFAMVSYLYLNPFVGTGSLEDGGVREADLMVSGVGCCSASRCCCCCYCCYCCCCCCA